MRPTLDCRLRRPPSDIRAVEDDMFARVSAGSADSRPGPSRSGCSEASGIGTSAEQSRQQLGCHADCLGTSSGHRLGRNAVLCSEVGSAWPRARGTPLLATNQWALSRRTQHAMQWSGTLGVAGRQSWWKVGWPTSHIRCLNMVDPKMCARAGRPPLSARRREDGTVDAIFIDGCHLYDCVKQDPSHPPPLPWIARDRSWEVFRSCVAEMHAANSEPGRQGISPCKPVSAEFGSHLAELKLHSVKLAAVPDVAQFVGPEFICRSPYSSMPRRSMLGRGVNA